MRLAGVKLLFLCKPPIQTKAVCTKSLLELFLAVYRLFQSAKRGQFAQTFLKLFAQIVFLFGWVLFFFF